MGAGKGTASDAASTRRRGWVLIVVTCAALVLAGCSGPSPERTLVVDKDADSRVCIEGACPEDENGTEDGHDPPPPPMHTIEVRVVDALQGTAVEGAPVVAMKDLGSDDETLILGPLFVYWEPASQWTGTPVATARTKEGVASFEVPPGMVLAFAARGMPGTTTELLVGVVAGEDKGTTILEVPVYTDRILLNITRPAAQFASGWTDGQVDAFDVALHDEQALDEAMRGRIRDIDATLSWENTLEGLAWGDMRFTVGTPGEPVLWPSSDGDDTFAMGVQEESIFVTETETLDQRPALGGDGLRIVTWANEFEGNLQGMDLHYAIEVGLRGSDYIIVDG